jgi:hypothetical protein
MSKVLHFVIENKALFSSLALLIVSEVLPFTKGKANGLLQGVAAVLRKTPVPVQPEGASDK